MEASLCPHTHVRKAGSACPPVVHPTLRTLCEQVMAGQLKTGEQIRAELKASIASLLQQRGGSAELALPEAKPAVLLVRLLLGWVGRRRVAGLAGHAALFGRDRSIAARAGVCAFTGA